MATQERPQHGTSSSREDVEEDIPAAPSDAAAAQKDALDADVDAILDEIDDLLEENAEEFVRGFVQKGGQ